MIVYAQAELWILLTRIDQERGRLLAALVAAGGFAGLERGNQPFAECARRGLIRTRGFADDSLVREHVAGDGITIARHGAAPVDALTSGVLAEAAVGIDDVQLALLAAFVGCGEALHHLGCRHAGPQERKALGAVVRIDEGLGGERADTALRVRAERAGGEKAGGDGDAERAARAIARNDRPRHAPR